MRASVPPANAARRSVARLMCAAVAACALVGCNDVVSLAPAVPDAKAIEAPALVGSWAMPDSASGARSQADSSRLIVRRLDGAVPDYLIEYWNFHNADSGEVTPTWYVGHVGRVGGLLLLEVRPAMKNDSILSEADDAYSPLLEATHMVFRLEVDSAAFRAWVFNPDSVQEVVGDGRCPGSYYVDEHSSHHMVLTGSSAEVRRIWACAGALPGFFGDSAVLQRRGPVPGGSR